MEQKRFRGFKLDKFQVESIESIEKNNSVVVSAATGTGKTLIADYVIDKYLKQGKKLIYTAPIKALSNQKYSDFKKQYGQESVGIMTGDVTINPEAPLLIMTTEIYRNMLLSKDPFIEDVMYVVFDEIHYLGDIERGTVWEESIIFSANHVRFLCLSATIPNARQFANWIQYIKKHDVDVVVEKKRAVPLTHAFYDTENGFSSLKEIKELKELDKYPKYNKKRKKFMFQDLKRKKENVHLALLKDLEKERKLPCIYFCFSREQTQRKAEALKNHRNYLLNQESVKASSLVRERLRNTDKSVHNLKTTKLLRECLSKGIAFHHAGMLPVLKEIVENLFAEGLVKVLFATETFAVGINMPAKTVCFDSLEKFDGINFRYLNSKEYFQLAGRAGRRGIDKEGFVVSVIERITTDVNKVKSITESDSEPLNSQFKLSYNTILNLIHSHNEEERNIILKSSFYSYQQGGRKGAQRITNSFNKKKKKLVREGYITEDDDLTEKGLFTSRIYTEELLVTEIFCTGITKELNEIDILVVAGRIVLEEKRNTKFKVSTKAHSNKVFKLARQNKTLNRYFQENPLFVVETFLKEWHDGCEFADLLEYSTLSEGDIVRYIRQILDLLEQVKHATLDGELKEKIRRVEEKIDRDVISVIF